MEANGTKQIMTQNMEQILASVPEERKAQFKDILDVDKIIEQLVPIYDKYYTEEDIKALVDFYESPVGKKQLQNTPDIMTEAVQVMIQYFQKNTLQASTDN